MESKKHSLEYKDLNFIAKDSLCIFYDVYVPNTVKPKAVIQIAHGMVEHKGRYEWLCTNLAQKGYIVAINDHRGHGKSIDSTHPFGEMRGTNNILDSKDFNETSGFYQAIRDMYTLTKLLKDKIVPCIQHYLATKDSQSLDLAHKESHIQQLNLFNLEQESKITNGNSMQNNTPQEHYQESNDTQNTCYAKLPFILLGHSMGSLLSRGYLKLFPSELDRLILSGSPAYNPLLHFGINLAKILQIVGLHSQGKRLINALSFGGFNKTFAKENPHSEFSTGAFAWLSRDKQSVQLYKNDKACQFIFSLNSFIDLFYGTLWVRYPIKNSERNKQILDSQPILPILIISGEDDACGGFGKGVKVIAQDFKEAGYAVNLKLYPQARHELFFEINKQEVFEDIIAWLEDKD